MKKRILSALLLAAVLAGACPSSAYATSGSGSVTEALPRAGISYHFSVRQVSLSSIKNELEATPDSELAAGSGSKTVFLKNEDITEADKITAGNTASAKELQIIADNRSGASRKDTLTSSAAQEVLVQQTSASSSGSAVTDNASEGESVLGALKQPASDTVVANVNDFVNVREQPDAYSEAVGKMHANAVGTLIETVAGGEWALVESGNVRGYVKAEFLTFGEEADAKLASIKTKIATVTADELNVREDAGTDSTILARVSNGEKLTVEEELDEWVRVAINGHVGYLYKEYVSLVDDYVRAESREEEAARIARAAELEQERIQALASTATEQAKTPAANKTYQPAENYVTSYSDKGSAVVAFALQFVGNPYVWGGSSLTNGTDCSGFTMSVYANFGVSITHASEGQAYVGYPVDGIENAMPGDIISYPGHVALYIGDGQIVHASHPGVGIIVSSAYYTPAIAVRRIFID